MSTQRRSFDLHDTASSTLVPRVTNLVQSPPRSYAADPGPLGSESYSVAGPLKLDSPAEHETADARPLASINTNPRR
jgi:hypothetical protein